MKTIRITEVCLVAIFTLSAMTTGSASANELLFKVTGNFLVTATGLSMAPVTLTTVNGTKISCGERHVEARIGDEAPESGKKTAHLFKYNILFLHCKFVTPVGQSCWTEPEGEASEMISFKNIGHLGLAGATSPGTVPAVLLLVKSFEFSCRFAGLKTRVRLEGDVIGEITWPIPLTSSSKITFSFKQAEGVQALRFFTFSLGMGSGAFDLTTTDILETKALTGLEEEITLNTVSGTQVELELHT